MLLAAMGALYAFWWIRGGRGLHTEEEIHVDAPPEAVFAILDDPERAGALDPHVVRTEVDGDRVRYHYEQGGRDVVLDVVVSEREPPSRLTFDLGERGEQRRAFTLTPDGGGTRVRLAASLRPTHPGLRLVMGMGGKRQTSAVPETLARLAAQASEPARSR